MSNFRTNVQDTLRVAAFLATRQLWRLGRGTTVLIVFIMTLTFLNLVVVNGVLVGLVEGSSNAYRAQYSGDILISTQPKDSFIERSQDAMRLIRGLNETAALTGRYLMAGRVEANYRERTGPGDHPDSVAAEMAGINIVDEQAVTRLCDYVIVGQCLSNRDEGGVMIGSGLLKQYSVSSSPGETPLPDVSIGSRVRVVVGGQTREVTVRGIVKSKISQLNRRVFFNDRELRQMLNRGDLNVDEIAVVLKPGHSPSAVKEVMLAAGLDRYDALVQTTAESQGAFYRDIGTTFRVLGNVIGSIALVVASLTIFIVILINALTRRKYIGIMKGIGISGGAIAMAYSIQAFVYAAFGTAIGSFLLLVFIRPYFDANPIDFPFSDGILAVTPTDIIVRIAILLVMTMLAGYFPARYIVRKNTLDTILGR